MRKFGFKEKIGNLRHFSKHVVTEERGVILLTLTLISIVTLIISGLIVQSTLDQVQTSYRNIRSSSAFGAAQTGVEDALKVINKLQLDLANGTMTEDQFNQAIAALKTNPHVCSSDLIVGNQECKWTLTQDSVVGTIRKDHAVTFDLSPTAATAAKLIDKFFLWECGTGSDGGSAMVITFIAKRGNDFVIPDTGGKIAIKCDRAPSNVKFDSVPVQDCEIGSGESIVRTGYKKLAIPANTKYLRIRAVGNDVKNLNILEKSLSSADDNISHDECVASNIKANFWEDVSDNDFALRDVITSEGIDGVSRISRIARSKDLQVPALLDFVLYTDGDITK